MKKNLSALSLLWISLTSMIGSGWLFGSLYSARFAGPAALIAWPLAGFLLLFVALSFAEIAAMFTEKGALSRLPLYTHGHLTSFIINSLTWISLATIPVIETQGLVQYASNYFPSLTIQHATHYTTSRLGFLFSAILLMSFVLLNYFGVRLFARINAGFTFWKLFIPAITIILLLTTSYHAGNFFQHDGFMPYGWKGIMAAISSGGVLFSLLGFRQVVIMMSEIENPGKYVPIVIVSSLLVTSVLYTALQWSFIGSLRPQDLTNGWSHLSFPGDAGPFAALAAFAGMIWLSILLYTDAFISPYSTALVYTTTAGHMLSNIASMKDAPKSLTKKNKYDVPWISLCVNFLIALIMLRFLHDWQTMSSFLVAIMMLSYSIGPICLICLRKQLPTYHRPFRLKYAGLIAFIGFYVCTAGIYWSGFESVKKMVLVTLIILMLHLIGYFFKKTRQELEGRHAYWLLLYIIGLGIFSYYGNYGGKEAIPAYWDLLYLMVFTLIIFRLAVFSMLKAASIVTPLSSL